MTHAGARSKATVLRRILLLTVFLAVSQSIVSAQVLNMSHDLVSLGIASQNLAPNVPSQDARPLIQAAVQYVQSHPVQVLTLDKGNYYLLTAQLPNITVMFSRLSNMTVDLAGSTIYFNGPMMPHGLTLYQCNHFTLTNFQTDFVNLPYTHVQLASVDAVQRLIKYQTLPGWPDPSSFNNLTSPFGPIEGLWAALFRSGAIVPGTSRTLLTGPIAGNTLTLAQDGWPWTQGATLSTLQPGDTVVVTARGGGAPILVWESDSITLSNITIYGSPTWAVSVFATSNSTVDGLRVMPRPGTGLVGSNGDGIHFASNRQNNHIRNSYVTRTLDDALIMDNQQVALVVAQTGPRQLSVTRNQFLRFPNGTAVNFVDPSTTMEIAGATIVSQNPPDVDGIGPDGQVDLTFDIDLPPVTAGMAMVYAAPAMRGQGSTIEDNLVEDTWGGRGVWVSGARGLTVQRNVLRRTSNAGIVVSQSTDPFNLGGFGPPAHDITIQDNSVEGALGPAANGSGSGESLASIQVVSTNNQQFGFGSVASNTDISIVNNTIMGSGRSAIWVGELNGGTIQNNLIGTWNQHPELPIGGIPPPFVTQVLQDFASPIVIHYSAGVTSQGNIFLPTASGVGAIVTNPYGSLGVQGADLIGNTISNLQSNAVIQLGNTPGGPGSFAEIDFQGFDIGAGNTLTVKSGAPGQSVFLYNAGSTASSIGGTLLAQSGNGAPAPGIYFNNRNGVAVLPGGNVSGVSGLTIDTLGSASTEGQSLVNQGVIDGGGKLQLNSARVTGGGAYKGNVVGVSTFGNANNPVNGSHFLSNGLQFFPSTGSDVQLSVSTYGMAPQFVNMMVNGNASVWMPSSWPAGSGVPSNSSPLPAGSIRPAGAAEPSYGGGSIILQATGSMTLVGGGPNDLVFPGGLVLKAGGTLNLNGVTINQGWTTTGKAFQGIYFESPHIISPSLVSILSNDLNWTNFSTLPNAHFQISRLVLMPDGTARYSPADAVAPHQNVYSTLIETAAAGNCWVCLINSTPIDVH